MLREKLFLGSVMVVLALGTGVFAADEVNNHWQAYSTGGEWNNPANWELGVPTLGQDARMDEPGLGPTISPGTNAVCDTMRGPSFEGGQCTMTINGGTLSIEYDWRIGDDPGSGPGIVNMNGGQVHLKARPRPGDEDPGIIKIGGEGEAIFNMYDGVITVGPGEPPFAQDTGRMKIPHEGGKGTFNMYGGRLYAPKVMLTDADNCGEAYINMYGGTFACAELTYPGTCPGFPPNKWQIDIYDGIIQVMGYGGASAQDKAIIDGYVAGGNIIANGGAGEVDVHLSDGVITVSSGTGGCSCLGDLAVPAGQVDLQDLDAMVNMLVAAGPPFIVSVEPGHCGDFDENGQVDLQDLDALVNLLVGAGPPFIVQCK